MHFVSLDSGINLTASTLKVGMYEDEDSDGVQDGSGAGSVRGREEWPRGATSPFTQGKILFLLGPSPPYQCLFFVVLSLLSAPPWLSVAHLFLGSP